LSKIAAFLKKAAQKTLLNAKTTLRLFLGYVSWFCACLYRKVALFNKMYCRFFKKAAKNFLTMTLGEKITHHSAVMSLFFHAHINLIFQSNRLSRENGFDL